MRVLESSIRPFIAVFAVRWLRDALAAAGVKVRLCNGCLQELVQDADTAAWRRMARVENASEPYLVVLRAQLAERARYIHLWTESDNRIEAESEIGDALVRIARKYALPRKWKLSEPPAAACRASAFSPWKWASGAV